MKKIKSINYEYIDDIWKLIKEFQGIYNITTKWNKLFKISLINLYEYYHKHYDYDLTDIRKKRTIKDKKILILKNIFKHSTYNDMLNVYYHFIDINNTSQINIGDEIDYFNGAGIVSKVNKKSLKIKPYTEGLREDIGGYYRKIYYNKKKFNDEIIVKKFKKTNSINFNVNYFMRNTIYDDITLRISHF
jgi:hypothetical protein